MSRMLSLRPYASWMTTTPGWGAPPSGSARYARKIAPRDGKRTSRVVACVVTAPVRYGAGIRSSLHSRTERSAHAVSAYPLVRMIVRRLAMSHSRLHPLPVTIVVASCLFAAVACGSTAPTTATSTPTSAAPTPSASALPAPVATPPGPTPWPFPGQPENCGPATVDQDGNITPALCPDGRPSVAAITIFSTIPSHLLSLGPDATATAVMNAACADLNAPAPNGGTIPLVTTEASLAFAENDWNFGGVLSPGQITQRMVAGAC